MIRAVEIALGEASELKGAVSLSLVDDKIMSDLNLRYRGRRGPTDVLAFPLGGGDWPDEDDSTAGEIVISVPQAERQAPGELGRELVWLAVHGVLHLLGFDHETSDDEKAMNGRAEEILADLEEDAP